MGLLECASGQSAWRGYEYYLEKRVTNVENYMTMHIAERYQETQNPRT